jgi:hypothetical protein
MNNRKLGMITLAVFNVMYLVIIGSYAFWLVNSILFYIVWGGLLAGFAYFAGWEKGESVKSKTSTNKNEEHT